MHIASLVLTVIGEDKPGLVEQLATLVMDHRGNWLESRMAHLGGQFAGILHVEVPEDSLEALTKALGELHERGLSVMVARDPDGAVSAKASTVTLELVGHDRPGIVRQLTRVIAAHGANVQEIETTRESAPMSGEALFRARAVLDVPAQADLGHLQADLEQVSHDLMVDLAFG